MKAKLLLSLLLLPLCAICQNIAVTVSPNPLTARKYEGEPLLIPIDVKLELLPQAVPTDASKIQLSFKVKLVKTGVPVSLQFVQTDFDRITHGTKINSVEFTKDVIKHEVKMHVVLPYDLDVLSSKALTLEIYLKDILVSQKLINIEPANDIVHSRSKYFTTGVELEEVTKVESNNNILTVSGYINDGFTKRLVLLEQHEVLGITDWNVMFGDGYLNSAPFSLVAVPFKIRPRAKVTINKTGTHVDTAFGATAMSGISNLGINVDIIKRVADRYFSSGKKATHKYGLGFIVTPGVEELGASVVKDTSLTGDRKSKQFYISAGLSLFYSYSGITFFVVPAAIDWAPSPQGRQWIYNKKFWWGFGIGISPTIFSQIFNK